MSDITNAQSARAREINWKSLGLRLLVALPLALFSVWVVVTIHEPFFLIAGMLTYSCSNLSSLWEIWLRVLWLGILLVSALAPSLLIMLGRRWPWVLLSMVAGAGISVTWYVFWFVIVMVGC